jgi:preprotein translocase subunit SecF
MSKLSKMGQRLYEGDVSINFVGRWKTWYVISGIILLISVGALLGRGLNLGIEFKGGADFSLPAATCSVEDARAVAEAETGAQSIVTLTGAGTIRVQTQTLTPAESSVLAGQLADACGIAKEDIKYQVVGPTWGAEISSKALQGLIVFILLVSLFLTLYFEWRMAVSALVALAHDLIITIGIYALIGLEVTPASVIGLLTILGYSLYDTVVVFDKVKENTRGLTGQSVLTYNEAANLAVNQTLVRSINTSVVALLPVLSIIFVGAFLLGAGTLLDLAVVLAIGMTVGTFSSIFIATPVLAQLKSATPEMKALSARVHARRAQVQRKSTEAGQGELTAEELTSPRNLDPVERTQPRKVPRSKRK